MENEANPERSELRDKDHLIRDYIVWWKKFFKNYWNIGLWSWVNHTPQFLAYITIGL